MKAIETEYKGYKFRSRLEARWAIFFDACGVRWEYEPEGYVPITPHLWMPLFISEETEREMAISLDLRLIDVCSELWVCGDLISDGMRREMSYAADLGIPIQHVKEEDLCTQ